MLPESYFGDVERLEQTFYVVVTGIIAAYATLLMIWHLARHLVEEVALSYRELSTTLSTKTPALPPPEPIRHAGVERREVRIRMEQDR